MIINPCLKHAPSPRKLFSQVYSNAILGHDLPVYSKVSYRYKVSRIKASSNMTTRNRGVKAQGNDTATSLHGYRKASVLLCYFPKTPNPELVEGLAKAFQIGYHFDTCECEIPMDKPDATQAFLQYLNNWIQSVPGDDTLRIVYYTGHAERRGSSLLLL